MLDFYLIVSDYRAAYDKSWLAAANRLIPPNVFYFEHGGLVAKYAVLSEADFAHECSPRSVDGVDRGALRAAFAAGVERRQGGRASGSIDTVSEAAPTLLGWTLPLADRRDVLGAVEARFAADVRSRAARRARGAGRLRSSMPTPSDTSGSAARR